MSPPPPTFGHAVRIAADALPRAEFRAAVAAGRRG